MHTMTLGQASRLTGTSKTTIARAINAGRLSATRRYDGSYEIDPAELNRVFAVKVASDLGPVITETVKRLKPGIYGRVKVFKPGSSDCVQIALTSRYNNPLNGEVMNAADCREAAATFAAIADALDEAE
jgi:excisionase family DNA binding protein